MAPPATVVQPLMFFILQNALNAVSGETTSTEDKVSLMNSKQKLFVVIAFTLTAVLLPIFLILLHKHRSSSQDETDNNEECSDQNQTEKDSITLTNSGSDGGSSLMSAHGLKNIYFCKRFNSKEVEFATNGFAKENVIREGEYGVVYRGALQDGSAVVVNLLNIRGDTEKKFMMEVEAIGVLKHRNLVKLIGFCTQGDKRSLVYKHVDNGDLENWLHGDSGPTSPLTWDIRMKIAIGIAKGLMHLHEGLEAKVFHRDVKSSNILLDKNWTAEIADFGLTKLLQSEERYATTQVTRTSEYMSPEYAKTGIFDERSDVYSFGVLLMEILSGRKPTDNSRPRREFKEMVGDRQGERLVDPKMSVRPSPRALHRALMVCLKCTDTDPSKRPDIGQIVYMLQEHGVPFGREPPARDIKFLILTRLPLVNFLYKWVMRNRD